MVPCLLTWKCWQIINPANVHYIMSAIFKEIFDVLGNGIFNSDAYSWKNQRKIKHTLINHQHFHRFLVKMLHENVEKGLIPILETVCKNSLVICRICSKD